MRRTQGTRSVPRIVGALLVALSAMGLVGCEDLRKLRELRDAAEFGASGYGPGGASGVEADASDDTDLPFVDAGSDVADDVTSDADRDSVFQPVDSGDADGPVFGEPPTIFDVFPASGPASGGTIVTVQGSRFTWETEVRIGGAPVADVDVIDQYELIFLTPPLEPGTYDIKVSTEAGTAGFPNAFTAVEDLEITGVEPSSGARDARMPVTIRGAGFSSRTRFLFGEREATDVRVVSADRAEVLAPPSDARGLVDVIAFGGAVARLADAYEYYERPELDALRPAVGPTDGGVEVVVDGSGIEDGCSLWFGGVEATVRRDDAGRLHVTPPGGPAGAVDVSVDCGERGASYHTDAFAYIEPGEPRVLGVWPSVGFTTGGAIATISGYGLEDAEEVFFGDYEAFVIESGVYHATVVTPGAFAGVVDVAVDALRLEDGFEYIDTPRFGGLRPSAGDVDGGWQAVLDGDRLQVVDALHVDGREVEIVRQTATEIAFTVPPGAAGYADVVADVAGLGVDTGFDIGYGGGLRFDGFEPRTGATTGGTRITLSGSGFDDDCVVLLDGEPTATDRLGTVLLVATAPPHDEGYVSLEVVGCGDGWTSPRQFQYVDPSRLPGGVAGGEIDGEINVSVVEAGTDLPIAGATVMVGVRDASPFVALTDERGQVTFRDESLRGPHTVTAYAEQRSAESYVNVDARDITLVLNQIPPPPCDPATDPDCGPPPPVPTGQIIGFLSGMRKIADPPPGAVIGAVIETTRYSPGFGNPNPGDDSILFDNGPFTITTRLGEMALIAQCGWFLNYGTFEEEFVPVRIGVTRGIFIREGDDPVRTSVDCNIPLEEVTTFKLTNAPELVPPVDPDAEPNPDEATPTFPAFYRIDATWDFGAEGHLETLPPVFSDSPLFTGGAYPALEGPLEDVLVSYTAGAYDLRATLPYVRSYARRIGSYDRVVTFPAMLPLATITHPSVEDPAFDGYVEWDYPASARVPDFYHFYVSASGEDFPRYAIFVPGYQRSLNLADFPEFRESIGWVPAPGDPGTLVNFYVRAIDVDVFDFDDFDRYALRSSNWRSVALNYTSVVLATEEDAP